MNHNITQIDMDNPQTQFVFQPFLIPSIKILPSSDLSPSQLKNKIIYNFWTTGLRLKIQKAKLVKMKFPISVQFSPDKNVFWYRIIFTKLSLS